VLAHNFQQLFKPTSVAVVGASDEPGTAGWVLLRNLTQGRFLGPIMPVSESGEPIQGIESYRAVDTLPLTPDLAMICAPHELVPGYIQDFGKRGVRACVILSRGHFRRSVEDRQLYHKALVAAAKPYGMRVLGPNCLGFINPTIGLNASLAHRDALPGKIAFISQSDSLFTSVLDWATSKRIGFSHFISVGDRMDIGLSHLLDYLNRDANTRAVLLYIETIERTRPFMSAARALARNKHVLVIKSGRSAQGAAAATAHSGSFLGADEVYDAAFRRAGMLRVSDIDALFDGVETLARAKPLTGNRLAILTNGGSPGFLAADELIHSGGRLAELSENSKAELHRELGSSWSYWNPLVLRSNADAALYESAIRILIKDENVDAVLAMHVPTAAVSSLDVTHGVIQAAKKTKRNILTSWLGIEDAESARTKFAEAGIPTYFTPERAIRGFLNMVQYRRNQELLMETPASLPEAFEPDAPAARRIVTAALENSRQILNEAEAMDILEAYGIPSAATRLVPDMGGVEGAIEAAKELGFPVALKILAPDIVSKTLAGGVALNLETEEAVRDAATAMLVRVKELRPDARLLGFMVQQMIQRPGAHELSVEISNDPVFGPTIRVGQGGGLKDILMDRQVGLPPLNMSLARDVVSRTKLFSLLKGYHDHPAADLDAIYLTLCKFSQLVIDIPEIFELEINPLYVDDKGVLALDAQVRIAHAELSGADQLAIRPYPRELEEEVELKNGRRILLRPIRPEDEPAHYEFLSHVSAEDKRYRFFGIIGDLPRPEMQKLTQIDYDREMAFVAKGPDETGEVKTLGVVRAMTDPENHSSEFAILVRSDIKRVGLGRMLMEKIIRYCASRGTNRIMGSALLTNVGMAGLAKSVGFEVRKNYDDEIYEFDLPLNPSSEPI
jgi:acetyltransferase